MMVAFVVWLLSSSYATGCLAALVIIAFIFLPKNLRHYRKLKFPPGPKTWPIIGNLHLIESLRHRSIHKLCLEYGPLMQLRFGSVPVVVGSSVEMARTFLKTMDLNFADRPLNAAGKYTTYNYSDITWAAYGPYWRQARKICLMELFSPKRLESYKNIREEELTLFLQSLYESSLSGNPIVLKTYLSNTNMNVISRMVMGKKILDDNSKKGIGVTQEEFREMLDELILLNGVLNIGDYIRWLGFLDIQGYVKRMKEVNKKFDMFLESVLDEHTAKRQRMKKADYDNDDQYAAEEHRTTAVATLVDVLLELADDPTLEVKLERRYQSYHTGYAPLGRVTEHPFLGSIYSGERLFMVKLAERKSAMIVLEDLLAGGTEESAVTIEWAMSELLKNPEIFKNATDELDRVMRNRWVEETDMENLPYIQAIIKETMRLHPVAPLLVPRYASEDCEVEGYNILKGTTVLVNIWTIGRDPKLWDKPEEFCPERFLDKKVDIKGSDFLILPFGAGRRMCAGYTLGLKQIQAYMANLLHGFHWQLPEGMLPEDIEMDEIFGISTLKKIPLMIRVQPRLPLELYYP